MFRGSTGYQGVGKRVTVTFFLEVRDKGEGVSDLRKPTAVSITNCVQIITDIFLCVSLHAVCMSMNGLEYALCFCLNI